MKRLILVTCSPRPSQLLPPDNGMQSSLVYGISTIYNFYIIFIPLIELFSLSCNHWVVIIARNVKRLRLEQRAMCTKVQ